MMITIIIRSIENGETTTTAAKVVVFHGPPANWAAPVYLAQFIWCTIPATAANNTRFETPDGDFRQKVSSRRRYIPNWPWHRRFFVIVFFFSRYLIIILSTKSIHVCDIYIWFLFTDKFDGDPSTPMPARNAYTMQKIRPTEKQLVTPAPSRCRR